MMGNVLAFPIKDHPESYDPHGSGPVKCIACKHEWVAVAPIGTVFLECPECQSSKGRFMHPFAATASDYAFVCNTCDCEYLYSTLVDGLAYFHCAGCGADQTNSILED